MTIVCDNLRQNIHSYLYGMFSKLAQLYKGKIFQLLSYCNHATYQISKTLSKTLEWFPDVYFINRQEIDNGSTRSQRYYSFIIWRTNQLQATRMHIERRDSNSKMENPINLNFRGIISQQREIFNGFHKIDTPMIKQNEVNSSRFVFSWQNILFESFSDYYKRNVHIVFND